MYESEANHCVVPKESLPASVLAQFAALGSAVIQRTLIPWGEHCTECAFPTCYTTCDLYVPRPDGKCRRFIDGMVRVEAPGALNSYILKIAFRRWAKLWAPGNTRLLPLASAKQREARDLRVAKFIQLVPLSTLRRKLIGRRYDFKKRQAGIPAVNGARPDCFLLECYNPDDRQTSLTLTLRPNGSPIQFQKLLAVVPGYHAHRIPLAEIEKTVDLSSPFEMDITPNEISDGTVLYFGCMDFVIEQAPVDTQSRPTATSNSRIAKAGNRICKCVVWDLDNTLWDGILVEDGLESITLKPGILDILHELDRRGILLSIASKNDSEAALAVLRKFGIEDLFLVPQISWEPKSVAVHNIATALNIGMDSLLFVDDSSFERSEVESQAPEVMVMDSAEYRNIPALPQCQVPITPESQKRRLFYREEQTRLSVADRFAQDYRGFLRECHITITLLPLSEGNLERVYELTQRTNQMNFSGNRYTRPQLRELLTVPDTDTYVIECSDRFGSYGTIGFCVVVRSGTPLMTDLMFSCRIQSKRVEHAVLAYLIRRYREMGLFEFSANYRKTSRNAAQGKVFDDLGFREASACDGVTHLVFPGERSIEDDGIIQVHDLTPKPLEVSQ